MTWLRPLQGGGGGGGGGSGGGILSFGNDSVSATITPRYLTPWYSDSLALVAPVQWRLPKAGTLRNLRVRHNIPAGNGQPIVYTVRINGVATLLSVSLASNVADGANLVNSVAVVAGDLIDVEVTKAGDVAASPLGIDAVMELA